VRPWNSTLLVEIPYFFGAPVEFYVSGRNTLLFFNLPREHAGTPTTEKTSCVTLTSETLLSSANVYHDQVFANDIQGLLIQTIGRVGVGSVLARARESRSHQHFHVMFQIKNFFVGSENLIAVAVDSCSDRLRFNNDRRFERVV
jgi:hypothetical protein